MLSLVTVVAALLRFRARACVVLACVAAMLFAANTASAQPSVQTQTRVWDFSLAEPLNVWLDAAASAEQRPGFSPAQPELASVSPHAARGATTAARATEILRPGGKLIGQAGSSSRIRILQGGQAEAEALFGQLTKGGDVVKGTSFPGTLVKLPGGGQVGFRPVSTSGPPTINVDVAGLGIREIKFIP